ncbi:hypothetical protein [Desulforhabdus amnigena]|jgi:hypothetical protein|uniref:Uncharacterized protein n=1 Tax=Desulforhabdus amnigena TaxID=40218 RepID=A0A9W6D545_9BACT|nr:hypothetical protein [Desulforhabdus amnigena]NLJ26653.1 hypothetical protein [Deltaproteobacteria bacterium]GLI34315.1 hypothetical protein DAMNIGENAA_17480 [Desulforhabdus amnigena]
MSKRLGTAMVLFSALMLLTSGMAVGATYPVIKGKWNVSINCVTWDESTDQFSTGAYIGTLNISYQDPKTGNFYGRFESYPLTGNVSTDGTLTAILRGAYDCDFTIFTCKVTGNKKILGTWNHYKGDHIDTCKVRIIKQ